MNGKLADPISSECSWVALNPDACEDCQLNPYNKPQPGPRLQFIFHLLSLQAAGAVFNYRDLKPHDWRDMLIVKREQGKFQEEMFRNHRGAI